MHDYSLKLGRLSCGLCFAAIVLTVERTLVAEIPPPIEWEATFGGSAEDNCHSIVMTADGGFLLGGDSASGISGNKTSRNYGLYDFWLVKVDANGKKLWDKSFGGSDGDSLRILAVAGDGGFLLGGWSSSGVSGNKTSPHYGRGDFWLVKVDAEGNKLWDKSFGGGGDDVLKIIVSTGDNGFLLGGRSSSDVSGNKTSPNYGDYDLWLVKVDANGNKLWDKSLGGDSGEGGDNVFSFSIAPTGDGGFLVGGPSSSEISGNKTSANYGGFDFWLAKVDANGNQLWDRSFGGSENDVLYGISPTPDGAFLLAGLSNSDISGNKSSLGYGDQDGWLLKVDASGNKLWENSFGDRGAELFASVVSAGDGAVLLVGDRACYPRCDDADYWIVKVDAIGQMLWDQALGGSAVEEFASLVVTSDGGLLLGGASNSGISGTKTTRNYGGDDFWVIKLAGAPKLAIERSANSVRISWPLSATDYLLDQADSLAVPPATINWSEVPPPYESDGIANFITVSVGAESMLYRLRKP